MEKSLICPISNGEKDRIRAIKESESFSDYAGLSPKNALHLRLLSEELLCMAGTVFEANEGEFWIVKCDSEIELHFSTNARISDAEKEALVNVSSEKKNAAYKGMSGLFRKIFDIMTNEEAFIAESSALLEFDGGLTMKRGGFTAEDCKEWSLKAAREQERLSNWDELEVSVISRLSNDVVVAIRNEKAEITVKMLLS